jgi:hypothetical protein
MVFPDPFGNPKISTLFVFKFPIIIGHAKDCETKGYLKLS